MANNPLPTFPTSKTNVDLSDINEVRQALQGDQFPRNSQGTPTARAGALGSRTIPFTEVHADRIFQGGNLVGGGSSLDAPASGDNGNGFPTSGVVSGSPVPGIPGSCGHLRFSTNGDFAYIAAGTVVKIGATSVTLGYSNENDVPVNHRIDISSTTLQARDFREYKELGPIWGWSYTNNGTHRAPDSGYFVFVDTDGIIYLTDNIAPTVALVDHLPSQGPLTQNMYCYVTSTGLWYFYTGSSWTASGREFIGAVDVDRTTVNRIRSLYSARTHAYRRAIENIPVARTVFGQQFYTAFQRGSWNEYEDGDNIIPVAIHNGQQVFYQGINSTSVSNRLPGGGVSPVTSLGEAALPAYDFLFAGENTYGWVAYPYNPNVTSINGLVRINDRVNIPIIMSLGGIKGVHAYLPARCILTACAYTEGRSTWRSNSIWGRFSSSFEIPINSCFLPGFFPFIGTQGRSEDIVAARDMAYAKFSDMGDFPFPGWKEEDSSPNPNGPDGTSVKDSIFRLYNTVTSLLGG